MKGSPGACSRSLGIGPGCGAGARSSDPGWRLASFLEEGASRGLQGPSCLFTGSLAARSVPRAGSPGGPLAVPWGVVSLCLSEALPHALLPPASAFTWEVKANSRAYNNQFKKRFLCWQRQKHKVCAPALGSRPPPWHPTPPL